MQLAKKYCPMCFSDIVGQDRSVRPIQNMLMDADKRHPFLLLHGMAGVGKTATGVVIALTLNCQDKKEVDDVVVPCGVCTHCRSILGGQKTQFFQMFNAARRSKVDDVRDFIAETLYMALPTDIWRVILVDEVHRFGSAAWDQWLVPLENPPKRTMFIFCTSEYNKVPPTIRSRAFNGSSYFGPIADDVIESRLGYICDQEDIQAGSDGLQSIVARAQGSLRIALGILDTYRATGEIVAEDDAVYFGISPEDVSMVLNNLLSGRIEKGYWTVMKDWIGKNNLTADDVIGLFATHITNLFLHFTLKYKGWSRDDVKMMKNQAMRLGNKLLLVCKRIIIRHMDIKVSMPYAERVIFFLMDLSSEMRGMSATNATVKEETANTPSSVDAKRGIGSVDRIGTYASLIHNVADRVFGTNSYDIDSHRNMATIQTPKGRMVDIIVASDNGGNNPYIIRAESLAAMYELSLKNDGLTPPDFIDRGLILTRDGNDEV